MIGATPLPGDRTAFRVWAPNAKMVEAVLDGEAVRLASDLNGYHEGVVDGIGAGTRYRLCDLSACIGRTLRLIAESDLNDPRIVTPRAAGSAPLITGPSSFQVLHRSERER